MSLPSQEVCKPGLKYCLVEKVEGAQRLWKLNGVGGGGTTKELGQAVSSGMMKEPAEAGKGLEGQVRVGLAAPEGEDCLATATITQPRRTVSFLLSDLLPTSEGRGPFFELQRDQ